MCYEIMKLCPPIKPLRLLDVACGEGKNAIFFARNGYNVTAFDVAQAGLDKARRLADQTGVEVNFFRADMLDFEFRHKWISGELFTYYADWLITSCAESVFDCMSGWN